MSLPRFFVYEYLKLYVQLGHLYKDLFVIHGSGVGGGGLVYANTHLIPPEAAFNENDWAGGKWKERLLPYYDIAKKMLGSTAAVQLGKTDYILKECADEMGRGETFYKVNVGVYFS